MALRRVFRSVSQELEMRIIYAIPLSFLIGCSSNMPIIDNVVGQIANANHLTYSASELIMCQGITVGEWMRSIGPYPEKVKGWRALCVGASLPDVPVIQ